MCVYRHTVCGALQKVNCDCDKGVVSLGSRGEKSHELTEMIKPKLS